MTARTLDKARLDALSFDALERWLVRTGWRREFHDPQRFSQYIKYRTPPASDGEPEVVDVLHRVTPDYALCMRNALAVLELVEGRSAQMIIDDIEAAPGGEVSDTLASLRQALWSRQDVVGALTLVGQFEAYLPSDLPAAAGVARALIKQVGRALVGGDIDDRDSTARVVLHALQTTGLLTPVGDATSTLAALMREMRTTLDDLERLVLRDEAPDTPVGELQRQRLAKALERSVRFLLMADRARRRERDMTSVAVPDVDARLGSVHYSEKRSGLASRDPVSWN